MQSTKPRILLVNPPIYDFAAYDFWLKPYGLLSVAGYLRGKAEFALFDYLDRLHPYFDDNPLQFDEWGRGPFYNEQIQSPPCLERIPRHFGRFGLPRKVFTDFLASTPPPDYVLIQTMMTYWYPGIEEVIEDIRNLRPRAEIVLGGNYVTLCPDHAQTLGADLLIQGTDLAPLWNRLALEPDLDQPALWEAYERLNT
ncbi:MAG: B12-binding domain-containing radical SAM protein, partial [Planctomycetota bacterium]